MVDTNIWFDLFFSYIIPIFVWNKIMKAIKQFNKLRRSLKYVHARFCRLFCASRLNCLCLVSWWQWESEECSEMDVPKQKEHSASSWEAKDTAKKMFDASLRIVIIGMLPVRSTERQWYADYENGGTHAHRGWSGFSEYLLLFKI